MTTKISEKINNDLNNGNLNMNEIMNHPNSKTIVISDFGIFTIGIDFTSNELDIIKNLYKKNS